jgi:hypothetical protein
MFPRYLLAVTVSGNYDSIDVLLMYMQVNTLVVSSMFPECFLNVPLMFPQCSSTYCCCTCR